MDTLLIKKIAVGVVAALLVGWIGYDFWQGSFDSVFNDQSDVFQFLSTFLGLISFLLVISGFMRMLFGLPSLNLYWEGILLMVVGLLCFYGALKCGEEYQKLLIDVEQVAIIAGYEVDTHEKDCNCCIG